MSMSLPSAEDQLTKVSKTYSVRIYDNLDPITVNLRIFSEKMTVKYTFGAFTHQMKIDNEGNFQEEISRLDKLLTRNESRGVTYRQYGVIDPHEGSTLNHVRTYFVSGAANGMFGYGITKEERFPDAWLALEATSNLFFRLLIARQSTLMILNLRIHSKTLTEKIETSQYISQWRWGDIL